MKLEFEVLKIVLPIAAILISIIGIYINKKNLKKQIRVTKLEEILEILNSLSKYYIRLFWFVRDLESIQEKINNGKQLLEYELEYDKNVQAFLKNINKEALEMKVSRLYVLTNAYLSNNSNSNLKARILALSHLYGAMFQTVANNDIIFIKRHYKEGIPKPGKLGTFIISIENDLIKEMELGHESLPNEDFIAYRDNQFKKDLGIFN